MISQLRHGGFWGRRPRVEVFKPCLREEEAGDEDLLAERTRRIDPNRVIEIKI